MSEVPYVRPSTAELIHQAEVRRRQEEEEDNRRHANSQEQVRYHSFLLGVWLYGSFLVPAFIMLVAGDAIERALIGAGPIATILTMIAPVAVSMLFVKDIVVDVIMDRLHDQAMYAIRPSKDSLYARGPARNRRILVVKLWSAGSAIVPLLVLWIASGPLDRALVDIGGWRGILAIAIPVISWAIARWIVIGRYLWPRHLQACKAESDARHEARMAEYDRERAEREAKFQADMDERIAKARAESSNSAL